MGKTLKTNRCIIIAGMLTAIDSDLPRQIDKTDFIICADRGYQFAIQHRIKPDLILGDFDSAAVPTDFDGELVCLPCQKDDTDLQFAAREGLRRGFRDFLLTGVTGGRLDHTFASFMTLNFLLEAGASAVIHDAKTKAWLTDDRLTIHRPAEPCYFSVFPFDGTAFGVSVAGGYYALDNADLKADFPIGVSNEFVSDTVTVSVTNGKCLVMCVTHDSNML